MIWLANEFSGATVKKRGRKLQGCRSISTGVAKIVSKLRPQADGLHVCGGGGRFEVTREGSLQEIPSAASSSGAPERQQGANTERDIVRMLIAEFRPSWYDSLVVETGDTDTQMLN